MSMDDPVVYARRFKRFFVKCSSKMNNWNIATIDTRAFSFAGLSVDARLVDAYDADTFTVVFPFDNKLQKFTLRLQGIDAPEMKGVTHNTAISARNRALELLTGSSVHALKTRTDVQSFLARKTVIVHVECGEFDKYGRILADVRPASCSGLDPAISVSAALLQDGLAYAYDGGTKHHQTFLG